MPARTETSIIINAPSQRVWDVLIDLDAWPSWNTWFTAMHTQASPPHLGSIVTFDNRLKDTEKPGTYTCRVTKWEPDRFELAWKGGPMPEVLGWVLRGHHWFGRYAEVGDGGEEKTRFEHGEEVEGLARFLVPEEMVRDLRRMLERFNGELKRRVEEGGKVGENE